MITLSQLNLLRDWLINICCIMWTHYLANQSFLVLIIPFSSQPHWFFSNVRCKLNFSYQTSFDSRDRLWFGFNKKFYPQVRSEIGRILEIMNRQGGGGPISLHCAVHSEIVLVHWREVKHSWKGYQVNRYALRLRSLRTWLKMYNDLWRPVIMLNALQSDHYLVWLSRSSMECNIHRLEDRPTNSERWQKSFGQKGIPYSSVVVIFCLFVEDLWTFRSFQIIYIRNVHFS